MKTTFFGLTSFRNSLSIQDQALRLVEQSGFPVVMGFEFYPCVIHSGARLTPEESARLQNLKTRGFEISEEGLPNESTRLQVPGQLVIRPLVPIQKLNLSLKSFAQVLQDSTVQWLQKYRIQIRDFSKGDTGGIGEADISTVEGVISKIQVSAEEGMARGWISIHLSNDLTWKEQATDSLEHQDVHLEMRAAFDEWILFFTNALLAAIPGSGVLQ